MEDKIIKVSETIKISDSYKVRSESGYLVSSNQQKCADLVKDSDLDENNIIDVLISLHIILEAGLNAFYRNIVLMSLKKELGEFEVMENVDKVSFIDKTVSFIYFSKFDFDGKLSEAKKYHSIIDALKDFCAIRNKLLHGHSISTIFDGEKNRHSELKGKITLDMLMEQMKKFRFILEGMRFYFDCLQSNITPSGKESFKKEYLSDDFLPQLGTFVDIK